MDRKKYYSKGGEQIMENSISRKSSKIKIGALSINVAADYTHTKPENCQRRGRIDIPGVTGYFYVILAVEYNRWWIHWQKSFCHYWEI